MKTVTLITTAPLSPYNKGEVFTVTEREAEALLNPTVLNENGRTVKAEPKVEVFNKTNKDHQAALEAQRGKTDDGDAAVMTDVVNTNEVQQVQEARNALADKARPVAAERAAGDTGEQDHARVEQELKNKK